MTAVRNIFYHSSIGALNFGAGTKARNKARKDINDSVEKLIARIENILKNRITDIYHIAYGDNGEDDKYATQAMDEVRTSLLEARRELIHTTTLIDKI